MTELDPILDYEEQAADWCRRIADTPLSDAEHLEFEQWIHADPRHEECFDEMVSVWKAVDAIAATPDFLTLRANALSAMEANHRNDNEQAPHATAFPRFVALAAMLILVFATSWYFITRPEIYSTGVGERRVVRLDDGSSVSLDASSEVAVDFTDTRRTIILNKGRAKFDVAHEPLRAFTVTAADKTVIATGTIFSVELLRNQTRVLLYEGHVSVVADHPHDTKMTPARKAEPVVRLVPGQELISSPVEGNNKVTTGKVERSLSWQTGRLEFSDEPLSNAVERINRYTDIPIIVGDQRIAHYGVSGVFDGADTSGFIDGITTLLPIKAERAGGKIILKLNDK